MRGEERKATKETKPHQENKGKATPRNQGESHTKEIRGKPHQGNEGKSLQGNDGKATPRRQDKRKANQGDEGAMRRENTLDELRLEYQSTNQNMCNLSVIN
jgi:hypothetical protein